MLQNCLDLRGVIIDQVMIPLEKAFKVSADALVD